MNEHFVNIKVDREERPDLDQIYMSAVMAMTGQGGWPMSVFLTPERKPFFGGTYFPPTDSRGMAGFPRVLSSVQKAWEERREEITESAAEMTVQLQAFKAQSPRRPARSTSSCSTRRPERSCETSTRFTVGLAGPPNSRTRWTFACQLRHHLRTKGRTGSFTSSGTPSTRWPGEESTTTWAAASPAYSTDERWLAAPHFEKCFTTTPSSARSTSKPCS